MEGVKGRTFGILMGCRHVYCLSCITEWRDKVKDKGSVSRVGLVLVLMPPHNTLLISGLSLPCGLPVFSAASALAEIDCSERCPSCVFELAIQNHT